MWDEEIRIYDIPGVPNNFPPTVVKIVQIFTLPRAEVEESNKFKFKIKINTSFMEYGQVN